MTPCKVYLVLANVGYRSTAYNLGAEGLITGMPVEFTTDL